MFKKKITISILILTFVFIILSPSIYAETGKIETDDYLIDAHSNAVYMITIKNQEYAYKTLINLHEGNYDIENLTSNNSQFLASLIAAGCIYNEYPIDQAIVKIFSVAKQCGEVRIALPRSWYKNYIKVRIYGPNEDVLPDPEGFADFIRNYFSNK